MEWGVFLLVLYVVWRLVRAPAEAAERQKELEAARTDEFYDRLAAMEDAYLEGFSPPRTSDDSFDSWDADFSKMALTDRTEYIDGSSRNDYLLHRTEDGCVYRPIVIT